ncbi:hypothetical protein LDENG_00128250 [Lucifuga dentata]|nr:hypothetical protein LDENG_00128250 [Lucifuga dentata]
MLPGQMDYNPSSVWVSCALKYLPREASRRHPDQMPKPPQLAPLDMKEQSFYSKLLLDVLIPPKTIIFSDNVALRVQCSLADTEHAQEQERACLLCVIPRGNSFHSFWMMSSARCRAKAPHTVGADITMKSCTTLPLFCYCD